MGKLSIKMLITLISIALALGVVTAESFTPITGQQISGDFGRAWLQNFLKYNEPPVASDQTNDLWSWGGAPKGKMIVGGKLVPDLTVNYTNLTSDWLGEMPLGTIVTLNESRYATLRKGMPLSPLYLSSDPWVRAQQLGTIVRTSTDYYYPAV